MFWNKRNFLGMLAAILLLSSCAQFDKKRLPASDGTIGNAVLGRTIKGYPIIEECIVKATYTAPSVAVVIKIVKIPILNKENQFVSYHIENTELYNFTYGYYDAIQSNINTAIQDAERYRNKLVSEGRCPSNSKIKAGDNNNEDNNSSTPITDPTQDDRPSNSSQENKPEVSNGPLKNIYCPIHQNNRKQCEATFGCLWKEAIKSSNCVGKPGAPQFQTQYCSIHQNNKQQCNATIGCQFEESNKPSSCETK